MLGLTKIPDDPIIANHRFCNVNREHDRVTIWVKEHVRDPLAGHPLKDWLYNVYLSRIFNEPESMKHFMPILAVNCREHARKRVKAMKAKGVKILRGAYLCTTHGQKGVEVDDFYFDIAEHILGFDLWDAQRLSEVARQLQQIDGIGDFMANQVVTDLRYHLYAGDNYEDWETFVLAGPGTRRGLSRYLYKNDPTKVTKPADFYTDALMVIRDNVRQYLPDHILGYFRDPNNLSNCFCEFDKYCRARDQQTLGERITLRPYRR